MNLNITWIPNLYVFDNLKKMIIKYIYIYILLLLLSILKNLKWINKYFY